MNTFLKNGWIQKLIIAIVIVLLFNFIYPNYAYAGWVESTLVKPILGLVTLIGDGSMWLIHKILFGLDEVILDTNPDSAWWAKAITAVAAVGTAIACIAIPGIGWGLGITLVAGLSYAAYHISVETLPTNFELPAFYVSPLEIFSNSIAMLDANFFNPHEYESEDLEQGESTAKMLKNAISGVYQALRTFALVVLLSVLVYIGIRIIIASTGQDKAKYKSMLFNWVVAACLLFLLHYIMVFCMTISEKISEVLIGYNEGMVLELPEVESENENVKKAQQDGVLRWMTNFAGKARIELQLGEERGLEGTNILLNQAGWTLVYIILIIYTVYFFIIYVKRVIYLAFLTMIAPLICMMYPIDKVKDGQSQTFDMWLKEYVFNVLLQPLHLLLYTILIGLASNVANDNIIYTVVAIGFLIPAEKFFRKMFGFDKATTAGNAGSFAAGALASQGLNKLMSLGKGGSDKDKKKDSSGGGQDNIRTQDNPELDSGDSDEGQSKIDTNDDYWGDGEDDNNGGQPDSDRDEVMDRYRAEGFGQNANGEYFNPWTDEYDENYDPHNDETYRIQEQEQQQNRQQQQQQQQENDEIDSSADDGSGRIEVPTRRQRAMNFVKGQTTKALRASGNALKKGGKTAWKKTKGLPKSILKGYAGLVAGGAAGMIGLAAGIADGKPGTGWQYTAAGMATGYTGATRTWNKTDDILKQNKYGTTDKEKIEKMKEEQKQIKSSEKAIKKFEKANREMFNSIYGMNSQRYMDIARKQLEEGKSEQEVLDHIRTRDEVYSYLSDMGNDSARATRYGGTGNIVELEDDYMQYMSSGVTNKDMIDKAMQVEHTGVDYDGVDGRTHKEISREEGMAAALENQKFEGKTDTQVNAYMKNKRSRNIETARENGMDKDAAEAFANRSEAATQKLRSMI